MTTKLLLDTNILLDAAMSERPDWAYAVMLLQEFAYGRAEGFIAATSLKDVYYVLTKYSNKKEARKYILDAMELLNVISVDAATCQLAARSNEPDFEDGIVRACAENAQVDIIISRDEAAFKKSKVRRLSAKEYVDLFCDVVEVEF
jgi:predicted nucleic acid-binding protein